MLDIGYWLDKDYHGQGIITRALKLLEDMAFKTNEWNRIQIRCDAANKKSQGVPRRAGYTYEGTLRRDYPYNDGTFGDIMVFSKLKSEWAKNSPPA